MIVNGEVTYDEGHHAPWCLCGKCEAEHPGKRDFWAAMENTPELKTEAEHDS